MPPFSLNKLVLMKREDERGMRGACVAPLILQLMGEFLLL
jgi:hypothetical protein